METCDYQSIIVKLAFEEPNFLIVVLILQFQELRIFFIFGIKFWMAIRILTPLLSNFGMWRYILYAFKYTAHFFFCHKTVLLVSTVSFAYTIAFYGIYTRILFSSQHIDCFSISLFECLSQLPRLSFFPNRTTFQTFLKTSFCNLEHIAYQTGLSLSMYVFLEEASILTNREWGQDEFLFF